MKSKNKEVGKKMLGLIMNKSQRKRDMIQRTAIYSLGIAAVFAVPAFLLMMGDKISFNDVILPFAIVIGVAFTTIYLLLNKSKKFNAKEKQLRKVNR